MENTTYKTDANDLSLDVIRALHTVDVKALSYVQLRRLYAALIAATNDVDDEIASRSDTSTTHAGYCGSFFWPIDRATLGGRRRRAQPSLCICLSMATSQVDGRG